MNIWYPLITVGISATAEQGVAVAKYSGRFSRMWAWDVNSLDILGSQDIKAAVELLDISADGRYCAYHADAHHRGEHYIAISRPPYFHALWLRDAFHLGYRDVWFDGPKTTKYRYDPKTPVSWGRMIGDIEVPGSPFMFEDVQGQRELERLDQLARSRCSIVLADDRRMGGGSLSKSWFGMDQLGRRIEVVEDTVTAEGIPFLDCGRTPFNGISPPRWAKHW